MNSDKKNIAVIITAAGSSTRMGGSIKKEYLPLNNGTILSESVKTFLKALDCSLLVITMPSNGQVSAEKALFSDKSSECVQNLISKDNIIFTEGGKTRQISIFNALKAIKQSGRKIDYVFIHDGARPFVTEKIIKDTFEAVIEFGAAVPGLQPVDTQKTIDENGFIKEHLVRSSMALVQTPQAFEFEKLFDAHEKASRETCECTDDTEIWGKYSYPGKIKIVSGDSVNKKITYSSDYQENVQMTEIRTGLGYDIHALVPERRLVIGGIELPFEKGEKGHSDGDALLHAITDSLLGASGLGDIGSYFPPEDSKWKDADSVKLLQIVWEDIKNKGWKLNNLDCVIKLEKPKFLPYRNKVIENIANALGVPSDKIFVKAKTGEKMDSVGKGDAIEAWCTCLLAK